MRYVMVFYSSEYVDAELGHNGVHAISDGPNTCPAMNYFPLEEVTEMCSQGSMTPSDANLLILLD